MAQVLIANAEPLFAEGLRAVVAEIFAASDWPFDCTQVSTIDAAMAVARNQDELEAILIDLAILGPAGLAHLVTLRGRQPAVPLIVLSSACDPQTVHLCMTCGVAGFIAKSATRTEIARALRTVFDGGIHIPNFTAVPWTFPQLSAQPGRRLAEDDPECGPLSFRQAAVLDLVTDGKSNKQIAWELSISETTVKAHMTAILRKLGVSSRAQAIVLLQRNIAPAPAFTVPV
jgi:DNA-binding NarL/FixJ family response regulator